MALTSATAVTASGSSSGTCQTSGPYKNSSNIIVYFKRGDKFPVDPTTGKSTTWKMVS